MDQVTCRVNTVVVVVVIIMMMMMLAMKVIEIFNLKLQEK
jgi:hypothetical protein